MTLYVITETISDENYLDTNVLDIFFLKEKAIEFMSEKINGIEEDGERVFRTEMRCGTHFGEYVIKISEYELKV